MKWILITGFLLVTAATAVANPQDSVGVKKEGGQVYVLHEVEKGQGLYGIGRRYGVPVDDIIKANPGSDQGIQIGQVLMIPVKRSAASVPSTPKTTTPANPPAKAANSVSQQKTHVVQPGETLSKICRTYGITLADLRKWNNLTSDNVKAGQELIISDGGLKPSQDPPTPTITVPANTNMPTPVSDAAKKPAKGVSATPVTTEFAEEGVAAIITDPSIEQERNFALHPTMPVGTIMMVTNLETNQSVFVRVQGNFDSATQHFVIQLSKSAAAKIGGSDKGFKVKLNYAR